MTNARLYQQAQVAAAARERERIARDLHDAVTQTIFSASLLAETMPLRLGPVTPDAAEALDLLHKLIKGALAEMRMLLLELRPEHLAAAPLPVLVEHLAEAFTGRIGTAVEVHVSGEAHCKLPEEVKLAFYRIAQEALNNVGKHANAAHVTVNLNMRPGSLRMAVLDDGCGFAADAVAPERLDDHPMMRNGLKSFLGVTPGMECVGEAGTGEAALEKCALLQPDVVLMDLAMPGMGGVQATRLLRKEFPTTQVIVLTSYSEAGVVQEAVNAGAIGYLLKNVSATTLAAAVEAAAQRRPVMGPEAMQALIDLAANPHPIGSDLTDRERELLQHLAEGCTNIQIAQRMNITEATVRFHVGNIFSKLEVGNRTEAVQVALRYKLVAFPK